MVLALVLERVLGQVQGPWAQALVLQEPAQAQEEVLGQAQGVGQEQALTGEGLAQVRGVRAQAQVLQELELEPAVQEQGLAPAEAHALKPAGSWVQGRAQSLGQALVPPLVVQQLGCHSQISGAGWRLACHWPGPAAAVCPPPCQRPAAAN